MRHQIVWIVLVLSYFVVMLFPAASITQFPPVVATRLDEYGGDKLNPCPSGAKGSFYMYKDEASRHSWFCDPAGNRFIMNAIMDFD
jgi:hypothetical protein